MDYLSTMAYISYRCHFNVTIAPAVVSLKTYPDSCFVLIVRSKKEKEKRTG
jgi:hypothetical protein